ncbi:MAG TPA: outer membrane beta-barrel protein [Flavobacterium sp.]
MKKLVIAFFILIGIVQSQAQVTFRPGINAGLNISKIQNTDLDSKTSFYIGGFGALKLSKFYTLQPEISYSRQGGKGSVTGYYIAYDDLGSPYSGYEEGNVELTLNYISSVTINKFNLNKHLYLLVGPFVDILVGSSTTADSEHDFLNPISKGEDIDFGIIGGAGFYINKGFGLESRIKFGSRDAYDNHEDSNTEINTNLVFQLGATYTFNVK